MARIMVVEDEPITAADLEQKLTALGHEVSAWLDTGEEAVAQAATVAPDLVLMDIRLRGAMSGIDAAQHLRARSDVPLVFLTAFADQETVDRACETQPYGYLLKPFTERSVATAVQVALARARAEQAHIERERCASVALRSAGEALVAVDLTFAIRFLNEHAEALLNVKERDVIGHDARQVVQFAEGGPDEPSHPLDAALGEARVTSSASRALLSTRGSRLDVSLSAAPVFSAKGEKTGAVLVFRQASSREYATDAEDRKRLDAFSAFSMQLSHEINNPLTYNLGALHLALRELDQLRAMSSLGGITNEAATVHETQLLRIERLLRDAHEGATRVAGVVRQLGSYSLSETELAPLRPVELLDLAIGLSGVEEAAHLRLVREVQPAPMVRANKWQLARLLAHGLQNIVDRRLPPAPGEVTLGLWVGTDARGWAELRAEARHGRVLASSSGQPGSEPSTERLRETSVAMTVAANVVENLGGELIFCNQSDVRALTLRLPPMRVAETQVEPEVRRTDQAAPRGSVLVVDDEPMIGRVLEITLRPEHDVTAVCSAQDALTLLERGDAFDVILCDLTMPGMNGQQFYERLCDTRPDVAARVIVMSGGALTEQAACFLKQMEGRRIDKPFRADQLLPVLAQRVRARRTNAPRAQA